MASNALAGADRHSTTAAVFNLVTKYQWDAKLALSLAGFALNYGEFLMLVQLHSTNQLTRSLAIMKQVPSITDHADILKPRFECFDDLIRIILEVARCIIEFNELPSSYIRQDVEPLSTAISHIPFAVYWSIRGVVASTAHINILSTFGHEIMMSNKESLELSSLNRKLKTILEHLKMLVESCNKYVGDTESYLQLRQLSQTSDGDNMSILKSLISNEDDLQPLFDGSKKKKVRFDVLRRKNVLLLISGLDISNEELTILEQIYDDTRSQPTKPENRYVILWIPITERDPVEWTDLLWKQYERLLQTMPWYSVSEPSSVRSGAIRLIKEDWNYRNKTIIVVLDPRGKIVCPNAIHMMWIWGSHAFPFTRLKEEALWREETWRFQLLPDGICPQVLDWVMKGRYIFMYGGDDIEWIRKFTYAVRKIALAANRHFEMVYVGKSNNKEKVREAITAINSEKLSFCWAEPVMIWFFWTRIQSMLFSKVQLGGNVQEDQIMQELVRLLVYDAQSGKWAILAKGSRVLLNGEGDLVLQTLVEYNSWRDQVATSGFDVAFHEQYYKLYNGA